MGWQPFTAERRFHMDIKDIILENLPDGVELPQKAISIIAKSINDAVGAEFIPKVEYRKKTDEIKSLNQELEKKAEEIKNASEKDGVNWKEKFEQSEKYWEEKYSKVETEYKGYKETTEAKEIRGQKSNILKELLTEKGLTDAKYTSLLEKQFDIDALEVDGKSFKGFDDVFKPVQDSFPELFKTEQVPGFNPQGNPPNTNTTPQATFIARLDEARKTGNTELAAQVKMEASEQGVYLI